MQKDQEALSEARLMELFQKFHDHLDEEEEETNASLVEEEAKVRLAGDELLARGRRGWELLKDGGLERSVAVETREVRMNKKRIQSEAKLLACQCYQTGQYLPLSAADESESRELQAQSIMSWSTS